jgi:hypothetical protein
MRAHGTHGRLGKRFAIVIGLAAAELMALGAQTAAAAPDVVKYETTVTIIKDGGGHGAAYLHGQVESKVRKCMRGRRVVVFMFRPGADQKVGTARTQFGDGVGYWERQVEGLPRDFQVYAKVRREEHDGFVCGGDRSRPAGRQQVGHPGPRFAPSHA